MEVITQILGGLGNQMFQYACGRAVAHRLNAELYLDLSWFNSAYTADTKREFMLNVFPCISYTVAVSQKTNKYKYPSLFKRILRRLDVIKAGYILEPDHNYWSGIERIRSSVYLSGFWQKELYFSKIASIIREEFTFPDLPPALVVLAEYIANQPVSVSIHIRRSDYVSSPSVNKYHGVCSPEYYQRAINYILSQIGDQCHFFLFSDEPDWVQNNFDTQGIPVTIVACQEYIKTPWHDMHLMSLCKHHIIANSSFSWWGAWLANKDGMVIAPKQWFAEETMKYYSPVPPAWVRI